MGFGTKQNREISHGRKRMETISQRRKRMETICVFYVISPMDSSNFPKEKKEDGDDLFLWFGLGLINVEHEEAPGSYGMDGFLSDQANAIPGIEEKEPWDRSNEVTMEIGKIHYDACKIGVSGASLQSMFMDSKLNNMQHSIGTLEKLCEKVSHSLKSFQDSDRSYDPPEHANVFYIQILDLLVM
ncbi:hypothetical protein RHSIM_Rhsim04G0097300 [Rhododendron simsii]|uniref:Uncharacterized protein n=1 Tax=Rhododendron simsii TaxID=118357 RepID=A0A834H0Z7_RHOSS|nr:hypothetical protein RHSIM_Rhsim04G0097300 [Rhododendron simsii]